MENIISVSLNGQLNFDNEELAGLLVDSNDWNNASEEERKEFIRTAVLELGVDVLNDLIDKLMSIVEYKITR